VVGGQRPGAPAVEPNHPAATPHEAPSPRSVRSIAADIGGPAAEQEAAEGATELDGHGVVQDGVDRTVGVDHESAE